MGGGWWGWSYLYGTQRPGYIRFTSLMGASVRNSVWRLLGEFQWQANINRNGSRRPRIIYYIAIDSNMSNVKSGRRIKCAISPVRILLITCDVIVCVCVYVFLRLDTYIQHNIGEIPISLGSEFPNQMQFKKGHLVRHPLNIVYQIRLNCIIIRRVWQRT